MTIEISNPYQFFTDRDGDALDGGYIYVGIANMDPESNPQDVFWDEGLTIPAAQPLRTSAGYIVNGSSAASVYTANAYSIRGRAPQGVNPGPQIFYAANISPGDNPLVDLSGPNGSNLVGFIQAGYGAVPRTVQTKLRETQFSVADFGATGDDDVDDAPLIQDAYDALVTLGGGTLWFPEGTWRCNLNLTSRNVNLKGVGRGASIIKPVTATGTAITAIYREGSWDGVQIRDLDFRGAGTLQGVGFAMGADPIVPSSGGTLGDEYDGHNFFYNCRFANFDKCIARRAGDIGLWVTDCQFEGANYHFWGQSNNPPPGHTMHNGCCIITRCHMQGSAKAVYYTNSPATGSGQVVIRDSIAEANSGFFLFLKSFNDKIVPGLVVENCWNEQNADLHTGNSLSTNINIDGVDYPVRWLYAKDTSSIVIRETPVGSIKLVNAIAKMEDCPIDLLTALDKDVYSSFTQTGIRAFGVAGGQPVTQPKGIISNFGDPVEIIDGYAFVYETLPPLAITQRYNTANKLTAGDCAVPLWWVGNLPSPYQSTTVEGDGILPGIADCQLISLTAGQSLYPQVSIYPGAFDPAVKGNWNVPINSYLVCTYLYKHVSGTPATFTVTGNSGLSADRTMSNTDWTAIMTMSKFLDFAAIDISLVVLNTSGSTMTYRCGGYAAIAFQNRQDALDYMNSRLFPMPNPVEE